MARLLPICLHCMVLCTAAGGCTAAAGTADPAAGCQALRIDGLWFLHPTTAGQSSSIALQVFAAQLLAPPTRLLGLAPARSGAFKPGEDAAFRGKIRYRQCRKAVFPPSDWDGSLAARSAALPKVRQAAALHIVALPSGADRGAKGLLAPGLSGAGRVACIALCQCLSCRQLGRDS